MTHHSAEGRHEKRPPIPRRIMHLLRNCCQIFIRRVGENISSRPAITCGCRGLCYLPLYDFLSSKRSHEGCGYKSSVLLSARQSLSAARILPLHKRASPIKYPVSNIRQVLKREPWSSLFTPFFFSKLRYIFFFIYICNQTVMQLLWKLMQLHTFHFKVGASKRKRRRRDVGVTPASALFPS